MSTNPVIDNRFEIGHLERDLLGRGGVGDLYWGRDSKTGQIVAINSPFAHPGLLYIGTVCV